MPIARWVAFSISAGIGTALALRDPAPLADPIACSGMFDLLTVIASRTWRDVPLGSMLAAGNSVMLFLALLLLARTVHTITSTVVITIAITLAAAMSAVFALALTPSPAVAFVVTIATWAAILRARREELSGARLAVALGLLALLAATVTPFMIPAVILAGSLAWKRGRVHAVLGAIVVLAPSFVVPMALPQGLSPSAALHLQSCVFPHGGFASLMEAGRAFGSVIAAIPVMAALAILGLLSLKRLPHDMARSLLPLTLVAFWGVSVMPAQSAWTMAPFVIVFWVLAAAGLAEVWEAVNRTAGGKVGAVALSIALVVLQLVNANAHRGVNIAPDGHERLTLTMMGALVGALPRGAGLVEEDAATDLLTRALPSRVRTSDRFHPVARDASAITEALRSTRVFALPRSQRVLQYAGFEMTDAGSAGAPGLAEIRQALACTADLGSAPADLAPIIGQRQFGLVADDERSRDRLVIVLAGTVPLSVSPVGWPRESMRDIQGRMFDLTVAADQRDFAEELRTYELSSWSRPNTRYVTRIEARRTPGAPLVLPIALGGAANAGTARVLGTSPDQHLRLCPGLPYDVRPLAPTASR